MSSQENVKLNTEISSIKDLPTEVVVIPIVNSPIFPGMIAPIILSEDKYTSELDEMVTQTGYVSLNLVKFKEGQEYVVDGQDEEEQDQIQSVEDRLQACGHIH